MISYLCGLAIFIMEIATTNKKYISNLIKLLGKVEGVIIQKKMSKHDLCRVCLSHNIRMYTLDKTRYQEIYEKQTGGTLITGDGRPDMVCYICNSQLQRFFKFLQMSEKTEKYLNKMCRNGVVLTQEKVFGIASAHCLSVKTLISMSVTGVEGKPFDSESIARTIDFEVPCIDKTIQDVAVKIESVDYEEIDLDVPEIDITTPVPEDTDSDETIEIVPAINNKEMILKQVSVALERLPITRSRLQKAEPTTKHFYSCKQCARRFRTVDNLNTHRKSIHRARRCECVKCDKTFAKPVDLRRHMLRVHSTRRPHVCPLCERRFKHRSMFYVHIRTHTGEKPFSCNWCDKTFNDKSNCRKHMKTHTDNPSRHACFLCDLTFNQRSRLLQHAVDHIL